MKKLKLIHLIVGLLSVLVFLGTGVFMKVHTSHVYESNHFVRQMFRSAHIYILLTGLLNVSIGSYLNLSDDRRRRGLQLLGSICLLLAPAVMTIVFFHEPVQQSLERPLTLLAVVLALAGVLFHWFSRIRRDDI